MRPPDGPGSGQAAGFQAMGPKEIDGIASGRGLGYDCHRSRNKPEPKRYPTHIIAAGR